MNPAAMAKESLPGRRPATANSRRGKTTGTDWRAAKTTTRTAILRLDPAQLLEPVERNLNHSFDIVNNCRSIEVWRQ